MSQLRKRLAALLLLALSSVAVASVRDLNVHSARDAFFVKELSLWSGIFNLIYGNMLSLDTNSSGLRDYQIKLNDGVIGNNKDIPGSFAWFDGPRAHLKYAVPEWMEVSSLQFQAIEYSDQTPPKVKLLHDKGGKKTNLLLQRKVLPGRGSVSIAKYSYAGAKQPLSGGTLEIVYDNVPLKFAFIDEIVFNELGFGRDPTNPSFPDNLARWKNFYGTAEFKRVRGSLGRLSNSTDILELLLGRPSKSHDTRLAYLQKYVDPSGRFIVYSFILHVDQTGLYLLDAVRGALMLPTGTKAALPLMVLNHQGTVYGIDEPLGLMGRRELAFAEELAANGVASLMVDSVVNNGILNGSIGSLYMYHPHWSGLAKDSDNVKRALDFFLSRKFTDHAGVRFSPQKVGALGFSYGALLSLTSAIFDKRYSFVGLSHLENYSQDWASFAANLYIPQLAIFPAGKIPLHVCELVKDAASHATVMATLGDSGLAKHYKECLQPKDSRVRIHMNHAGKTMTMGERQAYFQAIFSQFGISGKVTAFAPSSPLDGDAAPYLDRENSWRDEFQKRMFGH